MQIKFQIMKKILLLLLLLFLSFCGYSQARQYLWVQHYTTAFGIPLPNNWQVFCSDSNAWYNTTQAASYTKSLATTTNLKVSGGGGTTDTTRWSITGNAHTNPAINFIGTTDTASFVIKVDGVSAGWISKNNNNTGYGYGTLVHNTTGNRNTASGINSLQLNTTGSNNTANGGYALKSNTTGNNNTALGFATDVFTGNLSNATAIGYNTRVGKSDALILGNGAAVGIGTSIPNEALHVIGNERLKGILKVNTSPFYINTDSVIQGFTGSKFRGMFYAIPSTNDFGFSGQNDIHYGWGSYTDTIRMSTVIFDTTHMVTANGLRFADTYWGLRVKKTAATNNIMNMNLGTMFSQMRGTEIGLMWKKGYAEISARHNGRFNTWRTDTASLSESYSVSRDSGTTYTNYFKLDTNGQQYNPYMAVTTALDTNIYYNVVYNNYTGELVKGYWKGIVGATGATGTNGTNGATGATGATGTNGTNGTNGSTGATGATGTNAVIYLIWNY